MKFTKYSSIENAAREKTIDHIMQLGMGNTEFVQTLKIHGANYSLYTDGETVRRGKRSGLMGDNESFNGDFNFTYVNNMLALFEYLKMTVSVPFTQVSVHAEIFGGKYLHPDVERVKQATQVQAEVQYCPENRIAVFDIKIDDYIVDYDTMLELCMKFSFPVAPEIARGKFVDLMKTPVEFQDPLHKEFGLPTIEGDNWAEGWVLKPVKAAFFPNGERIILKGKHPKFNENGRLKGKGPKPVYELSDDANELLDTLLGYVNENRLRNVLSHGEFENITQKDFGKLSGLFAKDAYDDFVKDHGEAFEALELKDQHILKKQMNKEAGDVIRPNFVNIIDKNF